MSEEQLEKINVNDNAAKVPTKSLIKKQLEDDVQHLTSELDKRKKLLALVDSAPQVEEALGYIFNLPPQLG